MGVKAQGTHLGTQGSLALMSYDSDGPHLVQFYMTQGKIENVIIILHISGRGLVQYKSGHAPVLLHQPAHNQGLYAT